MGKTPSNAARLETMAHLRIGLPKRCKENIAKYHELMGKVGMEIVDLLFSIQCFHDVKSILVKSRAFRHKRRN